MSYHMDNETLAAFREFLEAHRYLSVPIQSGRRSSIRASARSTRAGDVVSDAGDADVDDEALWEHSFRVPAPSASSRSRVPHGQRPGFPWSVASRTDGEGAVHLPTGQSPHDEEVGVTCMGRWSIAKGIANVVHKARRSGGGDDARETA